MKARGDRQPSPRGVAADRPPLEELGRLELNVPGRHNLSNALAALAVGLELGLSFDQIATGLADVPWR